MKRIWIVLLVVAMVGALLAVPGTALAKGKPQGPPVATPEACGSSELPLEVGLMDDGSYVQFTCADVPSIDGSWDVTFGGYTGKVNLTTGIRNSIPGDSCNGQLDFHSWADSMGSDIHLGSDWGSGIVARHVEEGMYYTLDTTITELIDGNCTGDDGTVDWADDDPGFAFSVYLGTKRLTGSITVYVDFTPAAP